MAHATILSTVRAVNLNFIVIMLRIVKHRVGAIARVLKEFTRHRDDVTSLR